MSTRADRFTEQDLKTQIYSDFLTDLNTHPVSGDVVRFVNERAVIRSIKNLLSTDKGERFCQPDIGSNIRKLLFEPMGSAIETEIQAAIEETIQKHEPRATVLNIQTIPDYDNNRYNVTITLMLLNKQDPVTFSVTLERVR